jgi:hypothetical protein
VIKVPGAYLRWCTVSHDPSFTPIDSLAVGTGQRHKGEYSSMLAVKASNKVYQAKSK